MRDGLLWLIAACCRRTDRRIPDIAGSSRPRAACSGRPTICSASTRTTAPTISASGCGTRPGPPTAFPLRKDFDAARSFEPGTDDYPFVPVEGEGVHEIPVGPVHAGTIEPGHFRFSIVGEKVLRLEERLGYKHKGIEKRFESMTLARGRAARRARVRRLAPSPMPGPMRWRRKVLRRRCRRSARAVAARAPARARAHRQPPGRPRLSRQRRRRFAFGFAQFWRLKEDLLR